MPTILYHDENNRPVFDCTKEYNALGFVAVKVEQRGRHLMVLDDEGAFYTLSHKRLHNAEDLSSVRGQEISTLQKEFVEADPKLFDQFFETFSIEDSFDGHKFLLEEGGF